MRFLLALLTFLAGPALAQTVTDPAQIALVCAYNSAIPAPTSGQYAFVQCDSTGKLITTSSGSSGLTIGTTTVTGATAGQFLYSDGTLLQASTVSSTAKSALGNATNAASGLVALDSSGHAVVNGTASAKGQLQLGDAAGWSVPANAGNVPGYQPPFAVFAGNANTQSTLVMASGNATTTATPQIIFMQSAGPLSAPSAGAGSGSGALAFVDYLSTDAVFATHAIIEGGGNGGPFATAATVMGKVQLGVVNGGISNRPGLTVQASSGTDNGVVLTQGMPLRQYNTGYANVYNGQGTDWEIGGFEWSSNIWTLETKKGGAGTARSIAVAAGGTTAATFDTSGNTTLTGALTMAAGSAATPSFNVGNASTGLYKFGTNQIGLTYNGAVGIIFEGASYGQVFTNGYGIGFSANATVAGVDASITRSGSAALLLTGALRVTGQLTVPGAATAVFKTNATITSGAGASAGTLTNAPSTGNPTSWIPINDNGTTRYIPAW